MTKVLASGVVENLVLNAVDGKTYKLADLTVNGVFKRPQGLSNGMFVDVVEHPAAAGRKYPEKEIRLAASAAPQTGAPAQSQPSRSPSTQDVISRQWAISQAIQLVTLMADKGAIPAKVLTDKQGTLLTAMVGQYDNLLFNTVQTGPNFEKMPHFTGMVNEVEEEHTDSVQQ